MFRINPKRFLTITDGRINYSSIYKFTLVSKYNKIDCDEEFYGVRNITIHEDQIIVENYSGSKSSYDLSISLRKEPIFYCLIFISIMSLKFLE